MSELVGCGKDSQLQMTGFSTALGFLKLGFRAARQGWNGKGMYIELQRPDEHSKMTLPYIYMKTVQGDFVPWLASQTDILAEDWKVFCEITRIATKAN